MGFKEKEITAKVFNIQKCSIHDGPGMRTVVFLKGCPLRCLWCANPESQNYYSEITDNPNRCIGCDACTDICPKNCISRNEEGMRKIDRKICDRCGKCVEVCYAESKTMVGEDKTVEEIIQDVRRDKRYYINSGGGVTFSGGEPLTHPEFLLKLAKACHEEKIHTAIESCGYAEFEKFAPALEYIDFIFMDLKEIDPEIHKKLTGQSNQVILNNIRSISDMGKSIYLRVPVIPGCNDRKENLTGIAEFAASINNVRGVELLAYHALGVNKYKILDRPYELDGTETPDDETMFSYVEWMNEILIPAGKSCQFKKN